MELLKYLDVTILLWIQESLRFPAATSFWKIITFLGNSGWFWILTGILLIFFAKKQQAGMTALISIAVGFVITNLILKNVIARPRPFDEISTVIPLITKPADFSFPSGHTCASFAAAFVYNRMLPKKYGVPALILAVLIAFSRLYLGVHYPSDIIGGIVAAFAGSIIADCIYKKYCITIREYRCSEKEM